MRASNLRTIPEVQADEDIPEFGPVAGAATPVAPVRPRGTQIASDAVFLALKALSQRALVALSALADIALVASAFILWLCIIDKPSVLQLVGVGSYAVFILLAILLRGKR